MGWTVKYEALYCAIYNPAGHYKGGAVDDQIKAANNAGVPAYDTDANAALLLVARLKEQGWIIISSQGLDGIWLVNFVHLKTERNEHAHGETLPLAICAAFLATQGETKL